MDRKEELKTMLQDLINDKPEQASVSLHNYLSSKIKEISGTAQGNSEPENNDPVVDDVSDENQE